MNVVVLLISIDVELDIFKSILLIFVNIEIFKSLGIWNNCLEWIFVCCLEDVLNWVILCFYFFVGIFCDLFVKGI